MRRKIIFRVHRSIERHAYPNARQLARALAPLRLSADTIVAAIEAFSTATTRIDGVGYQQTVAKELELHLKQVLVRRTALAEVSTKVSPRLGLKCDIALARSEQTSRLFVEIEFRPNYEKDIIKFMIAARAERLAAGVLVVVNNRRTLAPHYTTKPQYSDVERVINELEPSFPLLLIGLDGQWLGRPKSIPPNGRSAAILGGHQTRQSR